jgi:hypothetical protein
LPREVKADGTPVIGITGTLFQSDCLNFDLVFEKTASQTSNAPDQSPSVPKSDSGANQAQSKGSPRKGSRDAIRPIYRTDKQEVLGEQHGTDLNNVVTVKAKDGYAVGGMTLRTGLLIDGLSLTFMRVKDGKLDPTDSYESDWIGNRNGGRETPLKGDGTPVIGIVGKANDKDCVGLGLVFDKK